jgi:fatty-acyl-CoA synthase
VVSVTADEPGHRSTYGEVFRRAAQLANALQGAGIRAGDRVGTLAWNDYRHLELYFAVSCMGAVLHTINPRLFPEQVQYIINDAADRLLFSTRHCCRCSARSRASCRLSNARSR